MQPGVYRITADEYHSDPCDKPSLSRGTIHDLLYKSPAHVFWNHPRLNPSLGKEEGESKFDIGTAVHSLFLEGIDAAAVIDAKDWKTKAAQEARDDARAAGKVPLLPHQYERVEMMVASATKQLAQTEIAIKDLRAEGKSELTYIWQEGETTFRIRPDWISNKTINGRKIVVDLKTVSGSADPAQFKASENGKDIQWALYRRGIKAVEGGKSPMFFFFLIETYEPFLCSLVGFDPQIADMAKQKVEYGKFVWEKCIATNHWPGYPSRVCYVEAKPWELASWELKSTEVGTW